MGKDTAIAWTDSTFNPWLSCTEVSPGCDNCYARQMSKRMGVGWGLGAERRHTSEAYWKQPLAWNRRAQRTGERHLVFCASFADVFDNEVPGNWRDELWALIRMTPHLTWQLLTKRIGNVPKMLPWRATELPKNVWLGISITSQAEADRDVPKLLAIPAQRRFVSYEPALGPVDFTPFFDPGIGYSLRQYPTLSWIIVGGESGPRARPFDIAWARSVVKQCHDHGVAVFVKQLGSKPTTDHRTRLPGESWLVTMLRDRKGADPSEWPKDLRVQEFP